MHNPARVFLSVICHCYRYYEFQSLHVTIGQQRPAFDDCSPAFGFLRRSALAGPVKVVQDLNELPEPWAAGGVVRNTSALRLGGLVPNISEFLRSFEKPSLAALPFLVGRGRVNQKVYLPARHLSCFRSFLRSRGGPLGARGMESRDDRPAFSANDVGGIVIVLIVRLHHIEDRPLDLLAGVAPHAREAFQRIHVSCSTIVVAAMTVTPCRSRGLVICSSRP